jgi:LysR family transcriptional regulator, regulator for metE and metH
MIQIIQLHALIAISQTGNMSNAAKFLALSQPALSQQITKLEAFLGTKLFHRNTNPVSFLPAGTRLLESAYEVTQSVTDSERDIAHMIAGIIGKLRLAIECHSSFEWLMPSTVAFQRNWPKIEVSFISGFHAEPINLLTMGKADLVFVSSMQNRVDVLYHPLFCDEVVALLAEDHPLLEKAYLTPTDFIGQVVAHYPISDDRNDLFREVLNPAKIQPTRCTAELTESLLHWVASNHAIAALPTWLVRRHLKSKFLVSRPIGEHGLVSNLYAVTTRAGGDSAHLRDFIKTLQKISFATLPGIQKLR